MVGIATRITELFHCNVIPFTDKKVKQEQALNRDALIKEIIDLKRELIAARSHFDWQTNFELIEADIFHINELEARYSYLIKQAKRENVQAFS